MGWDQTRDSQARPGAGDTPPDARPGPNPLQSDDALISEFGRGVTDDRRPGLNEYDYRESDQGPGGSAPPAPTPPDSYTATSYTYPTPRPGGGTGF